MSEWPPFREPLRRTLIRTCLLAMIGGFALSRSGRISWPLGSLAVLWVSLGGHYLEIWFLNWLRPRISPERGSQVAVRLSVWFVGGVGLATCAALTAAWGGYHPARWPSPWLGGVFFIGMELLAHLPPQFRGGASFYNGRG